MKSAWVGALLALAMTTPSLAQAPRPFPGATAPPSEPARPAAPGVTTASPAGRPSTAAPASTQAQPGVNGSPTSPVVFPVYPGAQPLGTYDAGKGQRYHLFGTTAPYLEVVAFYRAALKDRGAEVFAEPPTHMFSQRFREETMVFPPGVTVKDWTYQSKGYPNPKAGATPERFPTVVMIVPPLPDEPGR